MTLLSLRRNTLGLLLGRGVVPLPFPLVWGFNVLPSNLQVLDEEVEAPL